MIFRGELASQRTEPGLDLVDFILPFIKSPETSGANWLLVCVLI